MSTDSHVARLRRRLSRWRLEPAQRREVRDPGRQPASTGETSQLPTSQWYRGYSDDDLSVFAGFPPVPGKSQSGFIVDFLGVRTRVAHAAPFASFDGKVFSTPVPVGDWFHAETIEYVGLLKCVVTAKDRFVALELGAGWGPWLVSGAKAARRRGIKDIRLHGIEGDPEHFASMQTHFRDNGLDPAAHRLDNAAVGVTAGRARWPKSANPSADFALRPLVPSGEDASEARDATTSDYRGAIFDGYIDVEMFSLQSVLERESQWDLVHIDVQGSETELCSAAVETLNQRVRWLIIGTHSRKIDGDLIDLFLRNGWILENEKPARFEFRVEAPSLEAMTVVDGTQVWRNPRH